jgi:hypothetical protein
MAYSIEPSLPEIPRYEQWSTPETLPPTAHRLFPESPHLLYIPAIEHEDVFLWVWGCVTYKDVLTFPRRDFSGHLCAFPANVR